MSFVSVSDDHHLGLKAHRSTFRADTLSEFSTFSEMTQKLLIDTVLNNNFTDLVIAFLNKN